MAPRQGVRVDDDIEDELFLRQEIYNIFIVMVIYSPTDMIE